MLVRLLFFVLAVWFITRALKPRPAMIAGSATVNPTEWGYQQSGFLPWWTNGPWWAPHNTNPRPHYAGERWHPQRYSYWW